MPPVKMFDFFFRKDKCIYFEECTPWIIFFNEIFKEQDPPVWWINIVMLVREFLEYKILIRQLIKCLMVTN